MKSNSLANDSFVADIKHILVQARQRAYTAVNTAMVESYWLIGKRIVEQEQNGEQRAEYGQSLIRELSIILTFDFGKGFSETNIRNFRLFYLTFPEFLSIQQTVFAKLSFFNKLTSIFSVVNSFSNSKKITKDCSAYEGIPNSKGERSD